MTPTTKWVEAQTEEMIASSLTEVGGVLQQDLSDPNTTEATSGNLSRQSLWDENDF